MQRAIEADAPLATDWPDAAERFSAGLAFVGEDGAELVVDLGAGLTVHQHVDLMVGPPRAAEGERWAPVRWAPVGRSRLIPSFDGVIELRHGTAAEHDPDAARLRLFGTYTVPLGFAGRFGDQVRGRQIARKSLESLVQELARRFDAATSPRRTVGLPSPACAELLRDDFSDRRTT